MDFDTLGTQSIYDSNIPDIIKDYLRDDCVSDGNISMYWRNAVHYIESYTGLPRAELEKIPEAVHVLLALVADMHDNRQYQGDRSYINQLVDSMLAMYRSNFVPEDIEETKTGDDGVNQMGAV